MNEDKTVATRTCGFAFTTTGRPCANPVAHGELYCRAGHPCATVAPRRIGVGTGIGTGTGKSTGHHVPVFLMGDGVSGVAPCDRRRRAELMLARSLSHEDAEAEGFRAERLLVDPAVALALLGSPEADPAARDAVIQHFGLVGALLVVAYEDRWQRHLDVLCGDAETVEAADEVARQLERLVRHFSRIDARRLEAVLGAIDRAESGRPTDAAAAARHRLHAAYAVAARDGSDQSHHEYMEALNEVLEMARPAVAS